MIVVVGCGSRKKKRPHRAEELYIGASFSLRMAYAHTLARAERIVILSGKYGFIPLDRILAPYEHRLGDPGSITSSILALQARKLWPGKQDAIILAGKDYIEICRPIFNRIKTPIPSINMYRQMEWLKRQVDKTKGVI